MPNPLDLDAIRAYWRKVLPLHPEFLQAATNTLRCLAVIEAMREALIPFVAKHGVISEGHSHTATECCHDAEVARTALALVTGGKND